MPGATNSLRAQLSATADQAAEALPSNESESPFAIHPREELAALKQMRSGGPKENIPPPPPIPAPWVGQPAFEKPIAGDRSKSLPAAVPPGEAGIEVGREWTGNKANKPIWETLASSKTPELSPPSKSPVEVREPSPPKAPQEPNRFDRTGRVIDLSSASFDQALRQAKGPVLVDFSADWCGPCQQLSPKLDQLANDYAGKASVFRVNVDQNPDLAARFGVQGVPALKLFDGGKMVDQASGNLPNQALHDMLDRQMRRSQSNLESTDHGADRSRKPALGRIKDFIGGLTPFSAREKEAAMTLSPYEQTALNELNRIRTASGLNPLGFDPRLKLAALKKAEFANHRYDSRTDLHNSGPPGFRNPQQCFAQVGYNDYRECANTLSGGNFESAFGPVALMTNWLGSPSHRAILMSRADVAGIAVVGDKAFINVSSRENTRLPL